MTVHEIKSIDEFKQAVAGNNIVVLDAFATWCGPCKAIAPVISKWSDESAYEKVYFAKFDVDELPDLAVELGITAMPTFTLFKDGEKADELIGGHPPVLSKKILSLL